MRKGTDRKSLPIVTEPELSGPRLKRTDSNVDFPAPAARTPAVHILVSVPIGAKRHPEL